MARISPHREILSARSSGDRNSLSEVDGRDDVVVGRTPSFEKIWENC